MNLEEPGATPNNTESTTLPSDAPDSGRESIPEPGGPSVIKSWLSGFGAVTISALAHAAALVLLAFTLVPNPLVDSIREIVSNLEERNDELQEIELSPDLEPATEPTDELFSSAPLVGAEGSAPAAAAAPAGNTATSKLLQQFETPMVNLDNPFVSMPTSKKLIADIPEGALGDPRAIVDDLAQAFDLITREILLMLDRSDVLVVWCFDQSDSMKDDQQEILQRFDRVYAELGLTTGSSSDRLATAITSYGTRFAFHTPKPTGDLSVIQDAINSLPEDRSGNEVMCEAIIRAIALYRDFARKEKRQMALILVTDESGNRDNNDAYLERAIAEAKSAKCKIYTLGRESVFGYPYAHKRWIHPETNRVHWLRMDRGPETAFVEALQTDGLRRRYDAFGSGFAPYEQARMARETGGVFFLLPSVETNIIRGDKRRYELERLQIYKPDLRSRVEAFRDRDEYPLRTFIWQVVNDLNPYVQRNKRVELRHTFSKDPAIFLQQVRDEQSRATMMLRYLADAEKILEKAAIYREQEPEPRWQANYDLMMAQVVAYQARVYEYGAFLEEFIKNPRQFPLNKAPNLRLDHFHIRTKKKTLTEAAVAYVEKSNELFKITQENHPGTPWAARAEWELKRGFGIDITPVYYGPPRVGKPTIPVPKL
ncbi:MAG: vWA domain-containing protein [Pirellulaceae bacterium]|nr:VWA domain-containing protein [Planctomycetaceae bacterium]